MNTKQFQDDGLCPVSTVFQDLQEIPTFQSGALYQHSIHCGAHFLPFLTHYFLGCQFMCSSSPLLFGFEVSPPKTFDPFLSFPILNNSWYLWILCCSSVAVYLQLNHFMIIVWWYYETVPLQIWFANFHVQNYYVIVSRYIRKYVD